jgi:lipopolysaccharide transport system permease protein
VSVQLKALFAYRELVYNLAVRDLKLKYKRSAIGVAWSLLNPALMMAIYTVVFGLFLRVVNIGDRPYWALVLSGLLPWLFFSNSVGGAPVAFVHSANLLGRVHFPVETLPIAGVLANFVNFLISLVILLVVLVAAHLPLSASLMMLPVILLAQLAFTIGISLLVATLTVYFRDLEHLVGIGLMGLFYLTPVLYPLDPAALPRGAVKILPFLKVNPLAWYMESYHAVLFYGAWPPFRQFWVMMAGSIVALLAGYAVFLRLRARLPEEV